MLLGTPKEWYCSWRKVWRGPIQESRRYRCILWKHVYAKMFPPYMQEPDASYGNCFGAFCFRCWHSNCHGARHIVGSQRALMHMRHTMAKKISFTNELHQSRLLCQPYSLSWPSSTRITISKTYGRYELHGIPLDIKCAGHMTNSLILEQHDDYR